MLNEIGIEMKTREITFISADAGKLNFFTDVDTMVFSSGDVEELTTVLREMDLSNAYCSSSMDFASEYGFMNNTAAYDLLTIALERA
jgi:hypothetical protein